MPQVVSIRSRRRLVAPLTATILAAAVVVPAQEHQHGATTAATATQEQAQPLYTPEDIQFLSHMIIHHQQALDMSALVPSRSKREEFRRFARYIEAGQAGEIETMRSLLEMARERGVEIPEVHLHDDPPMHGMLSSAEMKALAAASGAEFERLWLEGMIRHHEGALDMARAQQEYQFKTGRRPYGIDVLVDEIIDAQRAEITQMRTWLSEWKLAKSQD